VVLSPPATVESGATGREIESRKGIGWSLIFLIKKVFFYSLVETNQILDRLRAAFDPLGVVSSASASASSGPLPKTSPKIAEASSVLGMADLVLGADFLNDFGLKFTKLQILCVSNNNKNIMFLWL
jgi:hypothetical protein